MVVERAVRMHQGRVDRTAIGSGARIEIENDQSREIIEMSTA
jgi:hypothetical protein